VICSPILFNIIVEYTTAIHNLRDGAAASKERDGKRKIMLAHLGSQYTAFHTSGMACWFCMPFCWEFGNFAMDPTANMHTFLCTPQKCAMEILASFRQAVGDESMSRTWMLEWKSPNSPRPTKMRRAKSKVQRILIIFFNIKGFCSQRIHTDKPNSYLRILLWSYTATAWKCTYNSSRNLARNLAVALRQDKTFARQVLSKSQTTFFPHLFSLILLADMAPETFLSSRLKMPSLWSNWGDRGRIADASQHSQTMTFKMHLKDGRSTGAEDAQNGIISKVMVINRAKVSFWLEGSVSPGNYE
jgi:hypothetical protein